MESGTINAAETNKRDDFFKYIPRRDKTIEAIIQGQNRS